MIWKLQKNKKLTQYKIYKKITKSNKYNKNN